MKYEQERAILETYGEILNSSYFKKENLPSDILHYTDEELGGLIIDLLREAHASARQAVFSVPASSSFTTKISLPRLPRKEIEEAIPLEARKYVPIPLSEVVIDWDILPGDSPGANRVEALLVAVPKEVIEKFRRLAEKSKVELKALEIESFSAARSLVGPDQTPTLIINLGHRSTVITAVDRGRLRFSYSIRRGSQEITTALTHGLGISTERAEEIKRQVGLSERIEETETASVIAPLVETVLSETGRVLDIYNRKADRKIQKIILTGGGAHLKGLVEKVVSRFGIEVTRADPFARIVAPAFLHGMLREIGPNFSVAAGLALRELSSGA